MPIFWRNFIILLDGRTPHFYKNGLLLGIFSPRFSETDRLLARIIPTLGSRRGHSNSIY